MQVELWSLQVYRTGPWIEFWGRLGHMGGAVGNRLALGRPCRNRTTPETSALSWKNQFTVPLLRKPPYSKCPVSHF